MIHRAPEADPTHPGDIATEAESARPSSARRFVLPGAVLALVLVAAVLAVVVAADDNVATQPGTQAQPQAPVAEPGEPRITIEAPAAVVAGKPATFTVNYALTNGRFSGSVEEWGDGVGGGSAKQERCESSAQTAGPTSGRYSVTHTWSKPGTYDVVLGVNTYTCVGTQSRDSKASRTLPLTVAAP